MSSVYSLKEKLKQPLPAFVSQIQLTTFCRDAADYVVAGFGRSNLVQTSEKMRWGSINDRRIRRPHISKLKNSMLVHGVIKTTVESAIPIALPQSWVKTPFKKLLSTPPPVFKDLPVITLTAEGQRSLQDRLFTPYGGNHRCLAINELINEVQLDIDALRKKKKSSVEDKGILADKVAVLDDLQEWSFV